MIARHSALSRRRKNFKSKKTDRLALIKARHRMLLLRRHREVEGQMACMAGQDEEEFEPEDW